ncbi:MAG TPA: hypothetical protein VKG82_06675 [Solirubrobacteraceae bacterium]|nr:hypothetical protein [Solirubrobacteraceae bacterium]
MSTVVKVIVAVWVGMFVLGAVAQTTPLFRGSLGGSIALLLLGGLGVLLFSVLGMRRLFAWLDSERANTARHEPGGDA